MTEANFSTCRYTADALPYMYGELPVSARVAFESHLLNCGDCTDEFAEISAVRFEVYEWKKLAFDPLATPRFAIPSDHETVPGPWFDILRAFFASSWKAPALALGTLVTVSIFAAVFILSERGGTEISSVNSDSPSDQIANNVGVPEFKLPGPGTAVPVGKPETTTEPTRSPGPNRDKQRNAVRRTARPSQRHATDVRAEAAESTRGIPPRLNEFADDEDTSLRLAELLEDIETSE